MRERRDNFLFERGKPKVKIKHLNITAIPIFRKKMATSFVGEKTPVLLKCKACQCVLKNAVKLSCGHRVCGDKCLKQLCLNPSEARCSVPSCDKAIIQEEVTVDYVIQNAVKLAQNDMQVHQNGCRIRTTEKASEQQASNVVLSDARNISVFQGSVETIRREVIHLSEEQTRIERMSTSFMEDLSALQRDVNSLSEQQGRKGSNEDISELSNAVKQLKDQNRNHYRRIMRSMACHFESSVIEKRETKNQLQQHTTAISRNVCQLQEVQREIQDLKNYNHSQRRVIRPAHQPLTAESDLH